MSLSAWEQNALDSIRNGLADSDPALVARMSMFSRLASGEAMPVRDKVQSASRRMAARRPGPRTRARRAGRMRGRLGLQWTMLLVWLVTTAALIAAALASSRVGHVNCTGSWGTLCSRASSAAQAAQPVP